jgi:hypothetical protein
MRSTSLAQVKRALIILVLAGLFLGPAMIGKSAASIPLSSAQPSAQAEGGNGTRLQPEKGPCRTVRRRLWVEADGWVIKRVPLACYSGLQTGAG